MSDFSHLPIEMYQRMLDHPRAKEFILVPQKLCCMINPSGAKLYGRAICADCVYMLMSKYVEDRAVLIAKPQSSGEFL